MESRPQNPEFRNNPEKFHQCNMLKRVVSSLAVKIASS